MSAVNNIDDSSSSDDNGDDGQCEVECGGDGGDLSIIDEGESMAKPYEIHANGFANSNKNKNYNKYDLN